MYSQNKCILNVKIPSFDQSTIYLTHNRNSSIESIKEKLEQQTGIPLDSQILSYSGYAIQDNASFEEIIQSNASCIVAMSLDIAVKGGAQNLLPFSAPDISSNECFEIRNFGTAGTRTRSSFRVISKGINFQAYCRTPTCIAFNNRVSIKLGMCTAEHGLCNYAVAMFELPCPACKQFIDPNEIANIYFKNCAVGVKCRIYQASGSIEYNMVTPADQYLALKEPERMLQYHFINFYLK